MELFKRRGEKRRAESSELSPEAREYIRATLMSRAFRKTPEARAVLRDGVKPTMSYGSAEALVGVSHVINEESNPRLYAAFMKWQEENGYLYRPES